VEFHFPYAFDISALAEVVLTSEMEVVLFNLPAGPAAEWAQGGRGIACHPARIAEFESGVATAIAYAQALGCNRLNCLAGVPPVGIERNDAEETLIRNLRRAADQTRRAGIELLIEPLNTQDNPGFLIPTSAQALRVIDAVGSDHLHLQYDVHHAQVMEGNVVNTLRREIMRIGHVQIADNPGRHQPGTGELNFPFIFAALDELGYSGWVGCEYLPTGGSAESLTWLETWLGPAGRS
jgi:hydroxypyruvate isomerase